MKKYYTREGLELARRQVLAQESKVRALGRLAGEEAGINCDWHDNFGYEDAKRRLELESTILHRMRQESTDAEIVAVDDQSDRVRIGVTARVRLDGDEREVTIGAFGESDPENGLVAYHSPLGRSLLGMEAGGSREATIGSNNVLIELVEILPSSYRYRRLVAALHGEQVNRARTDPSGP